MQQNLAYGLCASLLIAIVTSGPVAAQTARDNEGLTHKPMQPYRNADGSFKYAPASGFYGVDSFTYRADNGAAGLTTSAVPLATVTIYVQPLHTPVYAASSRASKLMLCGDSPTVSTLLAASGSEKYVAR